MGCFLRCHVPIHKNKTKGFFLWSIIRKKDIDIEGLKLSDIFVFFFLFLHRCVEVVI